MRHTYRFSYTHKDRACVKHFEADSQSAAVLDFQAVTGLDVEKCKAVIIRLDGAGLNR